MESSLEVLSAPAEFNALQGCDLSATVCIVFDVLRATTSMLTALNNGARKIYPVAEISDALLLRRRFPGALLAGERDGVRIGAAQTGGVDFDFGNSPREFTAQRVGGETLIMTTTNGTRALQACQGAHRILTGAFSNLGALAHWIKTERPARLLLIGAGTFEQAAYEDTMAAGALCDLIWNLFTDAADSAHVARQVFLQGRSDLAGALRLHSRNARKLLGHAGLRDDVAYALRRDLVPFNAEMKDEAVSRELSYEF